MTTLKKKLTEGNVDIFNASTTSALKNGNDTLSKIGLSALKLGFD